MTKEEKAKAYDEALEKAKKKIKNNPFASYDGTDLISALFPELKESENDDERIRKAIIEHLISLNNGYYKRPSEDIIDKWIAWLEKQGKCEIDCPQNHQDSNHPNGGIVLEDFNGGEGFYKVHLDYLNKKQVEEVEEMVRAWNKKSKASNEDEQHRKWILEYLYDGLRKSDEQFKGQFKAAIAWFEKQRYSEYEVENEYWRGYDDGKKQGKQKPADKVEPKFHKDEWITNGDYTWKIVKVKPLNYILQSQDGNVVYDTISHVDKQFHSFAIEDAKDGDILCSNQIIVLFKQWEDNTDYSFVIAYAGIDVSGKLQVTDGHWLINNKSKPATKEQRNFLFQKMKEAGYEWDVDKKELKKIEQKPAWSEEDEKVALSIEQVMNCASLLNIVPDKIDKIKTWLKSLKDRVQPQPKQEWNKEDEDILNTIINHFEIDLECTENDDIIRWLKSLRPQNTWKPSDEQIIALWDIISNDNLPNNEKEISQQVALTELYEQLKKLKGE